MIKALILYYLNIKQTHGYEIQRFIQMNEMDQWTKIQSGSIYYALGKLEKEGAIVLKEEVGSGTKARKIYAITDYGKVLLKELTEKELSNELYAVGSDKFILFPILGTLDKATITAQVEKHIHKLKEKLTYMMKWQKIKIRPQTSAVETIAFEMMITSLKDQIRWHEAVIGELDQNMAASQEIAKGIGKMDFSEVKESDLSSGEEKLEAWSNNLSKSPK